MKVRGQLPGLGSFFLPDADLRAGAQEVRPDGKCLYPQFLPAPACFLGPFRMVLQNPIWGNTHMHGLPGTVRLSEKKWFHSSCP